MLGKRAQSTEHYPPELLSLVSRLILKLSSEQFFLQHLVKAQVFDALMKILNQQRYQEIWVHITATLGTISVKNAANVSLDSRDMTQHILTMVNLLREPPPQPSDIKFQLTLNLLICMRVLLRLRTIPLPPPLGGKNFAQDLQLQLACNQYTKEVQRKHHLWDTLINQQDLGAILDRLMSDTTAEIMRIDEKENKGEDGAGTSKKELVLAKSKAKKTIQKLTWFTEIITRFRESDEVVWGDEVASLQLQVQKCKNCVNQIEPESDRTRESKRRD
jgi:hypothetical protein